MQILHQLADDDMFLFKEKLNYKLAGSGAYLELHITSRPFRSSIIFYNCLISTTITNMTPGSSRY